MKQESTSRRFEMDMTSGPMLPEILIYAIPLILTSVLSLLYNAADVVVVGRFAGAQALAAVGSTTAMINLLVNLFIGLSVGSSAYIARNYGARDYRSVSDGVHTAMTMAAIVGVFVAVFGNCVVRPLLLLTGSPEDVIDGATLYVRIFFMGMPFNMLYLFGAAVLRAVGDTRRPLYYLSFSGLVNVALNLVLVIVFHLGVAGVAIATITSQAISMFLVLRCLLRTDSCVHLDPHKLRIHPGPLKQILMIGLPAGLQSTLFAVSNVLIQSAINSFGSVVMAGNAAAASVEGFVYAVTNCLHQSALTFASANLGARKFRRVRRTLLCAEVPSVVITLIIGFGSMLLGSQLLSIYNSDPEVIAAGLIRFSIVMPTAFLCGIMDVLVGQLRGIGHAFIPMIVSLCGACLFRILWLATFFTWTPTLQVLYLSYPISWLVTSLVQYTYYRHVVKKLPREDEAL